MQPIESPHSPPTSPNISLSQQSALSPATHTTSNQCSPTSPAPDPVASSPGNSLSPNSPVRYPPLDCLFTTEVSDEEDRISTEGAEENEPTEQITFSSFRRARNKKKLTKKKLVFNDATEKGERPGKAKREDPMLVHSETQRMIRESKIRIPEYQPPTISLQDVLKKLPKLTKEVAKPDTIEATFVQPVPFSDQVTSTPLSRKAPAVPMDREMDELPEIDFASEPPVERLELTQFAELTEKQTLQSERLKLKSLSNQPTLPHDVTHLDLTSGVDAAPLSAIEAFKNRYIHNSLPPAKQHTPIAISAEALEESEPLLPSETLSKLSHKPGAVHAFLREKLRRTLLAKRLQEHENIELRLRYENEEYIPSEGSCSEAEDVDVKATDIGDEELRGDNEWKPDKEKNSFSEERENSLSEDNNNNNNNTDSSSSESESSESDESDGDISDSDEVGGELKMPSLKAKRQVVGDDSDNESQLIDANTADKPADFPLQIAATTHQPSHEPNLSPNHSLSQSILLSNAEQIEEKSANENDNQDWPPANTSFDFIPNSMDSDARGGFKIPSGFQLPHTQSCIPDDLRGFCDATQEDEHQLRFMCSGVFAEASQPGDATRDDASNLSADDSFRFDETADADIPVLAPRRIRAKDRQRLKRYRRLAEFEEREAELSGSDPELESASEFGDACDEYESEDGDLDEVDREEAERLNAKYYNKVMIEDDEANMELLKQRFLPEQDIVEDGLRMKNGLFRKRKFNFDAEEACSAGSYEWDEEGRELDPDQLVTQERRRRRVERDDYMSRKSSSLSEMALGETRTLPLVEKHSVERTLSCCTTSALPAVPSIRKSVGKHNSLLSRSLSANTKLDPNFLSDSNSSSNHTGRKAYVFQSIRSLEGADSSSAPSLAKSSSLPPASSVVRREQQSKTPKLPQPAKNAFLKPGSSLFQLLNSN